MMFVTNQKVSNGLERATVTVRYALEDSDTYLNELNNQITESVQKGFDSVTGKIKTDLEGKNVLTI